MGGNQKLKCLEGFSIKVKGVISLLGTNCTKKGGEDRAVGAKEEERWGRMERMRGQ